jgi:hypothetical protein
MDSDKNIVLCIIIVVTFAMGCITFVSEPLKCKWRWEDSARETIYSYTTGCKVQSKNGGFVPEATVREVD